MPRNKCIRRTRRTAVLLKRRLLKRRFAQHGDRVLVLAQVLLHESSVESLLPRVGSYFCVLRVAKYRTFVVIDGL